MKILLVVATHQEIIEDRFEGCTVLVTGVGMVNTAILLTKELLQNFKKGTSIALMIDQRVSEGIKCNLFNDKALTTTIPAQFVKKYGAKIVPIYIERTKEDNFNLKIYKTLSFKENDTIESITLILNEILEKMINKNPDQWIWTHNRWK